MLSDSDFPKLTNEFVQRRLWSEILECERLIACYIDKLTHIYMGTNTKCKDLHSYNMLILSNSSVAEIVHIASLANAVVRGDRQLFKDIHRFSKSVVEQVQFRMPKRSIYYSECIA